jgi:TonB family protein
MEKMKGKDKNSRTSLPDLLKYFGNKMSGRERNSLEREFQKDPFAEEAAEGFSGISSEEISGDMSELNKRLRARANRRQKILYYRIAASVAVLMILSSIFIIVNRNKITNEQAEIAYNSQTLEINQPKPITEPEKAESEVTSPKKSIETDKEKAPPVIKKREDEKSKPGIVKEDLADKAAERFVPSVVTDSISILENQDVTADLSIKTDTQRKEEALPSPAELNEIVVVGYGVTRAKAAAAKADNAESGFLPPEPVVGRKEFDKYIDENIKNPASLNAGKREVVILRFTVTSSGSIGNIKVLKTPGVEFSKEAERLIRNGPAWKPAESNGENIDAEVSVRIVFK